MGSRLTIRPRMPVEDEATPSRPPNGRSDREARLVAAVGLAFAAHDSNRMGQAAIDLAKCKSGTRLVNSFLTNVIKISWPDHKLLLHFKGYFPYYRW